MAKECFVPRNFNAQWEKAITQANSIVTTYRRKGFTLTLRQLYYQFVAHDMLKIEDGWRADPKTGSTNNVQNYKKLGAILNDARLAGLVDWSAIEDRTRNLETTPSWDSPALIVEACASQFKINLWADQKTVFEVWVEKEALIGVVEPIAREFRTPYFACRGYVSQSEQYAASKRLKQREDNDQRTVILHLGDHDPSGIDMSRDMRDRMALFLGSSDGWELRRIALNMDQVTKYAPPPNPAKATDARFAGYQDKFGDESWELDALSPEVIAELVRAEIIGEFDPDAWEEAKAREEEMKAEMQRVSDRWDAVVKFVN